MSIERFILINREHNVRIDNVFLGRFFTLLEFMKSFPFHRFYELSSVLEQVVYKMEREGDVPIDESDIDKTIESLASVCKDVGLQFSFLCADRLRSRFFKGNLITHEELSRDLATLQERIADELSGFVLMRIPQDKIEHLQARLLFGESVGRRFPDLIYDIEEAGKCLATGRATATVFHLMRIMEAGLQCFGKKLGVNLVEEKSWYQINSKVTCILNQKIEKMKNLKPEEKEEIKHMSAIAAHLNNVRIAWRNEVAHPKKICTEEEAVDIFEHVAR